MQDKNKNKHQKLKATTVTIFQNAIRYIFKPIFAYTKYILGIFCKIELTIYFTNWINRSESDGEKKTGTFPGCTVMQVWWGALRALEILDFKLL